MKHVLRTAAAILALALAGFGLTGCSDSDDDCDASSATVVQVEPAGYEARTGGTTGGGRVTKPRPAAPKTGPKTKPHKPATRHGGGTTVHIDTDDCEDNDS